jgi:hypothetical protein
VYVKEQLDHSKIGTTVDIYGHLIPNSNREAVNRLDSAQPDATYTQPKSGEDTQLFKIVGQNEWLVPKARLELARGNPH